MTSPTLTVRDIDPADWPALSAGFRDLTYEQTRSYSDPGAKRIGGVARYVAVQSGDRAIACAALRFRPLPGLRRGILWAPSGPLILAPDQPDPDTAQITAIFAALKQHLVTREGNILRLRLSPLTFIPVEAVAAIAADAGFAPTTRNMAYRTFALNTALGEAQLIKQMTRNWRGHLRKAEELNMTIEQSDCADLTPRFSKLYSALLETKGFSTDISPEFHLNCRSKEYGIETFVATWEGRDQAAGMMGVTGLNATYLFTATSEEGRDQRAGFLVTWSFVRSCIVRGLNWLDLGGVDFETNKSVASYKERTGAVYCEQHPFEAAPSGAFPRIVHALEDLRARMKGKKAGH